MHGLGYAVHEMDADTGLTYMQQLYYAPTLSRFLSIDPVAPNSQTGANFNRFWYGNANPYRFTDSDGRESVREMIDSAATGCGAVSCAGYAFVAGAWGALGAEGVSQWYDKGDDASGGDKAMAVLEVATAGVGGKITGAVRAIGGLLGRVAPVAKGGGQLIYRYRNGAETATRLGKGAADALKKIGVHGVSVTTNPVTGRACGAACRVVVEKVFPVVKTGADPNHFTVVLPEPVMKEVADQFNALFRTIQ